MNKNALIFVGLFVFLLILIVFSMSWGRFSIPVIEVIHTLLLQNANETQHAIIFNLRLPRIFAAILVGGALAIAGVTYQGIFRNPLVSPDILGVSNGACVGAAIAILLGTNIFGIQVFAFLGGLCAVMLTMNLPRLIKRDSTIILVLSGIIVSGFMLSTLGLIKYLANPETQLADIVYWQLGSLTKANFHHLIMLSPIIISTALLLYLLRWRINVLSLGDREARLIGANIRMERHIMVINATLLTSAAVCLSGTIGWLGLIIPHLSRLFIGDNNLNSLPLAAMIGAIFLLIIDTLARNLYIQEIPLGILTGFIGAPFFAWVLIKQNTLK
ncbi:iron ABC transporter permease [Bisgaard Taxon 45]|uniref:Iron ABC transporter permease n=1 Tax=Bisgaard Taxon 45 TaxID=304289 RepID=A0ABT9KGW2_9PAST|nr:iron ABC transporter permease [Bisgaard Taxon 45]